jgi:hypothetical protein
VIWRMEERRQCSSHGNVRSCVYVVGRSREGDGCRNSAYSRSQTNRNDSPLTISTMLDHKAMSPTYPNCCPGLCQEDAMPWYHDTFARTLDEDPRMRGCGSAPRQLRAVRRLSTVIITPQLVVFELWNGIASEIIRGITVRWAEVNDEVQMMRVVHVESDGWNERRQRWNTRQCPLPIFANARQPAVARHRG